MNQENKDNKETEIDSRIQNLQKELDALKEARKETKKKPWAPPNDGYVVAGDGSVNSFRHKDDAYGRNGSICNTRAQALELSKNQRIYNKMCQLAFEFNPSKKLGGGYCIGITDNEFRCYYFYDHHISGIFETREAGGKAAKIMNEDKESWTFYK